MTSDVKRSLKSVCKIYFNENAEIVYKNICDKYKGKNVSMSTLITDVMRERDIYAKN